MIFVHGHTFVKKNNFYYTTGSLNEELFKRYIDCFGEVSVFATERLATEKDDKFVCTQNRVECVSFHLVKKTSNIFAIMSNCRNKLKPIISKQDFVIARLPSIYGSMAIYFARKQNKPYLIELVGCPWDSLWNHSWKGKLFALFMWFFTRKAVKKAPYVLYVTNQFLQYRYPCIGKTIGCSNVALPPLEQQILEKRLIKIKQMGSNKPVILGTIAAVNVRYKGQEYVIRAISQLNKEGYDFEYHLVGGGDNSYLKSIAQRVNVADKVKFLGALPHEEVFEFLDKIDIYIQPSKTEGLPRALIEAMSRGCPSIGSKAGGIPELLDGDMLFKPGTVNEIINILKRFNIEKMIEQADRNFEKAREYDKELLYEKRMKFYMEFIRKD